MAEDKDPREEALWEYANEKLQGMLQPMMEDLFLARPSNPAEYIVQYLSGTSSDGAKRMDALSDEIMALKAQLAAGGGVAAAPAAAAPAAAAPAAAAPAAAEPAAAASSKYIVEGTPEADAVDQDFALVMNASLAKNEYPAAELEAARAADHTSLSSQFCTPEIWEQYKDTVSSGPAKWTLARAINSGTRYPSSFVGCHAGDSSSYDDFKDFFYPVIQAYHKGFDIETTKHVTDMDPSKISTALSDTAKSKIISTRIRVARNLSMFPLNPGASKETRPQICDMMEKVYAAIDPASDLAGDMFRHTTMSDEQRQGLIDDHFLFRGKDKMQAASGYHEHWPEGRGVFHNKSKTFVNWLNEGDHLRIISMEQGGDVLGVFTRLAEGAKMIEEGIKKETGEATAFMMHPIFGSLTCCPSNIGTGMRGSVHILVPKLIATIGFDAIDKMCRERNCQARGSSGEHSAVVDRIDVSNWRRIGFPEYELVHDMIKCANFLAEEEDKLPDPEPSKYIVEGTPEADAVDQDFALVMNASLAKNEYPAAELEAARAADHTSLSSQFCTPEIWEQYKDTVSSGPAKWTLARAINSGTRYPSSFVGCHAGDSSSYDDFKDFFYPVIQAYHKGFDIETTKHVTDMDPSKISTALSDTAKSKIISTRIRVARNLSMFPLNPGASKETRPQICDMMEKVYAAIDPASDLAGDMFRHTTMSDEQRQGLIDDHFLFRGKDKMQAASGYHEHWPEGRGVFHNKSKTFVNWLNEGDHLRIISMEQGGDVLGVFTRLAEGAKMIEEGIKKETGEATAFMMHPIFGSLTCCPSNIGTGMRGSVHILVPKLIATIGFDAIDKMCRERNCQARGSSGEHSAVVDRIDVSNWRRIGFPEYELVHDMIKCANFLAEEEDKLPDPEPSKYIVEGTPEADAVDQDFALVMNASLAKNEYPAAELEAARAADHTSLSSQFCTPEIWEQYKDTVSSGPAKWTLARAINSGTRYPSSFVGCHAGDSSSYDDFKDFFYPVIQAYHKGFDIETTKHVTDMDPSKISTALSDTAKSKIISTRIRVARNLSMFPLNPGASKETRPQICDMMEKVYAAIDPASDLAGDMFRHTTMSDEQRQGLIDDHFLFRGKDKMQAASGYHEHWPEGRGVFHNKSKTFVNWLNEGDHLRIISMEQGGDVLGVFTRLAEGAKMIEEGIKKETGEATAFMMHPIFGSLTCCPSNIGTGMRGSVHILVPKLIATIGFDAIDKMCRERNCQARGSSGEHSAVVDRIDVSNWRRIGFPEYELVHDMIKCANFLAEEEDKLPDPPAADPVEKIATLLKDNPDNICLNTFDPEYYNSLSDEDKTAFLQCLNSGIENPDSGMGCYAMQPADYDKFKPFFSKALAKYHKVAEDAKHVNDWSLEGVEGLPEGGVLDIAALGLPELSMRVRVGRNLKAFPLPGAMTKEDRCNMENFMLKAFEKLIEMPEYGGKYCSFTPGHPNFVDETEYQALVDAHIAFKDMSADTYLLSAGIAKDWPHGRGVYVSEDKGFIIWCGEEDHLRIMCMEKGTILNKVFDRLKAALDVVNGIEGLEFAISPDYGVVTSCPTNLGTGMRASLHIQLPNLTSDGTDTKAKEIAKPLGLSVRGLGGEHTPIGADGTVDISPSARFCIKEAEIITALYKGIEQLKAAEDAAAA